MEQNKTMKTGALYIRVSTDKQEELSPDAQKRLLLEYAKKNRIVISNEYIYVENGISGRKANKRPQFQQMIARAKSKPKPFDIILVWKYSRFARNQEESIVYKSLLRKQCGVEVISISEPLIDGPFGSLIERIIEWMDEYYSVRLSGEVVRGMTEKALRGGYQSYAPLGYVMKEHVPVVVPETAAIVKKIFSDYLSGLDETTIARNLNTLGYRTLRGNCFDNRGISYILENPFYIGKVRWNYATTHGSRRKKNDSEIIIADGTHEALISPEIFQAVQEKKKKEFRPLNRHSPSTVKHWLSGLLKCGRCGASLVYITPAPRKTGGSSPFFQCHAYSKGQHAGSSAITEKKVIQAITLSLEDFIVSDQYSYSVRQTENNSTQIKSEHLNAELSKITSREKRAKMAYLDGIDTSEEYRANKAFLQEQRATILSQLDSLSETHFDKSKMDEEMQNRVQTVYEIICSDASKELKGNAIRGIIEKIVFYRETETFEFFYYYL